MRVLLGITILLFLAFPSFAGYISLETKLSSEIVSNTILVDVNVINKGDEAAYNVQGEIAVGGKKFLLKKVGELGVNESYQSNLPVRLRFKSPGEYPLTLLMHYADANQYPFSALTCQVFPFKTKGAPGSIFGKMGNTKLWKEGALKLTLRNIEKSTKKITTCLAVPRELTVKEGPFTFDLPGKSKKEIRFPLENFSALSGSSYQVFAISEYEQDGAHKTNITPGIITVKEEKTLFGINYLLIIAAMILMVLFFIFAQFAGKKKVEGK
ncbi:MAG: hypothetical protein U9R38_00085 [Candidatus Margulisiibacteriota bacterium]|nr:hypothetical protein [Candidatus Margulisiibacteriota bacterium]